MMRAGIYRTALLVLIGFICSNPQSALAAELGGIAKRPPIEGADAEHRIVHKDRQSPADEPISGDRFHSADQGNQVLGISLSLLTATRERPIFSPTRRPPPLPPVQVTAAPSFDLRPKFSLIGAISGEHESIAILQDETTKVIIRLRTGESHSGWTLQMADGREVTLQNDRETLILGLPSPPTK